jgi:hypothetical protein
MYPTGRRSGHDRSERAWAATLAAILVVALVAILALAALGLWDAAWDIWLGLW